MNSELSELLFLKTRWLTQKKINNYINKDNLLNNTYFIIENNTIDHFSFKKKNTIDHFFY